MAERVVKVTVTAAVNSYLSGMDQVAKASRQGRTEAEALTAKLEAQQRAFNIAGGVLAATGGLIAAGLILATKRAADFDAAMSNVAATGDDARGSISALREAAIDAGAETVFSARESAGAIEELAKAGIEAKDILAGGLTGALNLAAAGGLEVADAAETMSDTLNQFKLSGKDATRVADVLAAGAGKASGGVDDLGMALKQAGQVASATGLTLEETTAGLAAFASAGLKGSDAGTSFKTMLGALTPNSAKAAEEMKRLGINAFDSQGKFIGLTQFAGQLRGSLSDLTDEQRQASLEIMFGSDAVRAGIELYNQGAEGISKWVAAVDDQGFAADQAAERLNNLNGDLEKLSGAFDSALISIGSSGQGPLRVVVQGLTEIVDGFNGLPEGAQASVFWIGAVGSAAALAGGAFFLAIPKVAAFKLAMADLNINTATARGALGRVSGFLTGPFAIAITGAALGMEALRVANEAGSASLGDLKNALTTSRDALVVFGKASEGHAVEQFFTGDSMDALRDLPNLLDTAAVAWTDMNLSLNQVSGLHRIEEIGKALADMDSDDAAAAFSGIVEQFKLTDAQASELLKRMPELRDKLVEQASEAGEAATAQGLLKRALGETTEATKKNTPVVKSDAEMYQEQADKVEGVRSALKELFDQINSQNSIQQQAIQANAEWLDGLAGISAEVESQKKAYEDANGTLDGFTLSLDTSTASGAANASMLAGLAGDAQEAAAAQFEVDKKTMSADDAAKKYQDTLAEQRRKFEESATAAGYNADEVKRLADKVFELPTSREVDIIADTSQANGSMQAFWDRWNNKQVTVQVKQMLSYAVNSGSAGSIPTGGGYFGGIAEFYARGGIRDLVPMDKIASFVAPNTWRVVGDRPDVPEAFIPLDGSARSRSILAETNRRMPGWSPMAQGGFVQPRYASTGGGSGAGQIVIAPVIHAAPGMDENALVNKAVRKIEEKLK